MTVSLTEMIRPHVGREEIARRMQAFYREVDELIARRKPTCWNIGACCKFGQYGHRLFVTGLELAYFVQGHRADLRTPDGNDACPYQSGGMCTAREHRPLGCRIFFCDPTAQSWQPGEYEAGLDRLKRLGEALGMDYRYVEWLGALREVAEGLPEAGGRESESRLTGQPVL